MAKLKNLAVSFISLVKNPANKKDIVWKSKDTYNTEKIVKVAKLSEEGLVKGTVYEPFVKDTDGDWADKESIQKAAHSFLQEGKNFNVDTSHNEKPIGAAVVESHINDKGAWEVTIKMDTNSTVWEQVKKGEYAGLSMMAMVEKSDEEPPNQPDTIQLLKEQVEKQAKELEALRDQVAGVSKSKQLVIDENGLVTIQKNGEKANNEGKFPSFDFNNLK